MTSPAHRVMQGIAGLVLATVVTGQPNASPDAADVLVRSLEEELTSTKPLVMSLAAVRPAPVAELFTILDGGELPRAWLDDSDEPVVLDSLRLQAVLETFPHLPHDEVAKHLEVLLEGELTGATRETAVRVLGGFAEGAELPLLTRLARPGVDEPFVRHSMRAAYRAALDAAFEREPLSVERFRSLYVETYPALLAGALDALAESGSTRVPGLLASLLGAVPDSDSLIMRVIPRAVRDFEAPYEDYLLGAVRGRLHASEEPGLLGGSILAAGELEDGDAVPALARLLEHDDANVRRSAHRALRRIAGIDFRRSSDAWSRWYRTEREWWERSSDEDFSILRSGDLGEITASLQRISHHRLYRHRLAAMVAESVLDRDEPGILRVACSALAGLNSRAAVRPLIEVLDHDDEAVRDAACDALRAVTGLDLPPDSSIWAEEAL